MKKSIDLSRFKGWDSIGEATKESFLKQAKEVNYDIGSKVFLEKTPNNYVYFIVSGFLVSFKIGQNGREKYLYFLSEGDFFNLTSLDGKKTTTAIRVLDKSRLLVLHKDYVLKLMKEDFDFNLMIVNYLSLLIRRTQRQALNLGTYNTKERLAARLWKLAYDYGYKDLENIMIDIPINQTDLSNIIGSSRESVNRALRDLEKEGKLSLKNKTIIIKDLQGLLEPKI